MQRRSRLQLTGELLGVPLVRLEQSQTLLQQCLQVGILRVRNESVAKCSVDCLMIGDLIVDISFGGIGKFRPRESHTVKSEVSEADIPDSVEHVCFSPVNRSGTAAHLWPVATLPIAVVAITFVSTRPDAEIATKISAEVMVSEGMVQGAGLEPTSSARRPITLAPQTSAPKLTVPLGRRLRSALLY